MSHDSSIHTLIILNIQGSTLFNIQCGLWIYKLSHQLEVISEKELSTISGIKY